MPTGSVLWFNEKKGFGFIKPDEAGPDLFIHVSDVVAAGLRHLDEGQRLAFEVATHGNGKFYATALSVIESQPAADATDCS
ncbi:MAG TPA: cold shock domain-containing protein [Dongiaceae bacterium]